MSADTYQIISGLSEYQVMETHPLRVVTKPHPSVPITCTNLISCRSMQVTESKDLWGCCCLSVILVLFFSLSGEKVAAHVISIGDGKTKSIPTYKHEPSGKPLAAVTEAERIYTVCMRSEQFLLQMQMPN